jgi:dTDP-4-dehydrorhamnose reductase
MIKGYLRENAVKYAVVGSRGLFGSEMVKFLSVRGENVTSFNRTNLDLDSEPSELEGSLSGFDLIINAIAYTDVDKAETEIYEANRTNGIYAGKLAEIAAMTSAKYFHISTDYVFDGMAHHPYRTTDSTGPQTQYGRSKLLGENLVSGSNADYTIFRTAWLYGSGGRCFPKAIAGKLTEGHKVQVVSDQIGQPTWTKDLAELLYAYSKLECAPKIVHAVASGQASWADFAFEVAVSLALEPDKVIELVDSSTYPRPAKRPLWSVLDNFSELVTPIGNWRERWNFASAEVLRGNS